MVGASSVLDYADESSGIMTRSLDYLYTQLDSLNIEYAIRISCLELYQENIYDLLVEEKDRVILPVREHPTDGFFVEGCQIAACKNAKSALKTIDKALRMRHVGSHDYNHRSNRSHFITEVYIDLPGQGAHLRRASMEMAPGMTGFYDNMEDDREYTVMGRMTFVDLAGSERLKDTKSQGKVLHETGSINKSLYVLGKVISGMAKSNGMAHKKEVPFRDSKLTKLLINSLGGASRTMMISCVSESSGALPETLRTLRFSMSAARIRNKPIRFLDPQEKLIMELREEIKRLKNENKALRVGIDNTTGTPVRSMSPPQQASRHVAIQDSAESPPVPQEQKTTKQQGQGQESRTAVGSDEGASHIMVRKVKVNYLIK
jgi:kinesin family member 12